MAQLGRGSALPAGPDRAARRPRGAGRGRRRGDRRGTHGARRRGRALLHGRRVHRRRPARPEPAEPCRRRRRGLGPGQVRGGDRPANPERDDLGLRARAGEPRRHRQAERGRRRLHRHTWDGVPVQEPLLPDRGDGAGARGRDAARDLAAVRARAAAGCASRPRGPRHRRDDHPAHGPRLHDQAGRLPAAAGRDAGADRRPRRRVRPLRVLRLPPHRDRAAAPERAHGRAAPAAQSREPLRAGGGARELGARRPLAARAQQPLPDPRISRFVSSKLGRATRVDRSYRVYASERRVRFTEMEYAIPRRHAAEAIPRVLEAAEAADPAVGFPIEVRFVAGDDSFLSPGPRPGHRLRRRPPVPGHGVGGVLPRGRGDHVRLRRAPPLGQAPLPDGRDPRRALSVLGGVRRGAGPARPGRKLPQRLHRPGPRPGPVARGRSGPRRGRSGPGRGSSCR